MNGLRFNSKFEDYMNKNFGYSELYAIVSKRLKKESMRRVVHTQKVYPPIYKYRM